ncbi:hypothetical protein [Maridesulfovibrio salexigens]|uniref:Uncharacterized protein n=1 Tax=Maridesulfovibrio salexigens (strain ATCC 14822 / DSM 2638 / NCIMB 8403 / VKM B-1763) TaxID=526222 RepID=C6BX01_MARSD|nr:hypothetical protein [Maridesulfovibrio salexigens]ACS78481.1 hypothetical protein Desal_0414 [Maridesulfovibrio salexigens DSM 2638]
MNSLFLFFAAVLAGVISADMFVRGWNGFLECAASLVLFFQKKIPVKTFLSRLGGSCPVTILCFLLLILCFKVYFSILGFGASELEQLGFFLGAVPRTGYYLISAGKMIDGMFKP